MLFEVSTSSTERAALNSMATARENLNTYLSGPGVVPSGIASSGYEIIGRPGAQQQVINWFNNNMSIVDYLGAYGGTALHVLGKIVNVTAYFEVKFQDGVTARFRLSGLHSVTGPFELTLIQIRDEYGNLIPVIATDFEAINFEFEDGAVAFEQFLEAAMRIGVPIVRVGLHTPQSGGSTSVTDIVCDLTGSRPKCSPVGTPSNPQ